MKQEDLTLYSKSEEVQEIITAVPSYTLRYGITVIGVLLILFALFSVYLQYPDVVKTNLKINSLNAPKPFLQDKQEKW